MNEKYGVTYSINERIPDDLKRRSHADAKRRLFIDISQSLFPNVAYTISYSYHERQHSYGVGIIECSIVATVCSRD